MPGSTPGRLTGLVRQEVRLSLQEAEEAELLQPEVRLLLQVAEEVDTPVARVLRMPLCLNSCLPRRQARLVLPH